MVFMFQDQEESDLISPSVEDRLRSLLCTPNPGGQNIEEVTIPCCNYYHLWKD